MEQLGQDGVESNQRRVVIISQESFYRELCAEEAEDAKVGNFDFDHPGDFLFLHLSTTVRLSYINLQLCLSIIFF